MNLVDKVVLITGASEGIGAACARAFLNNGAFVSLFAPPSGTFITSGSDGRVVRTAGDITDLEARREVVCRTIDYFGRIDVLINNVGVGQYGWPSEVDTTISKRMFDVNVFSPLALTQIVVTEMRRRRSGVIVNLGSIGGKVALPWAVMYCATKYATHCINDSLRRELSPDGIHVMKVCPGGVSTEFRNHVLQGEAPKKVQNIRWTVTPEQVAQVIVSGVRREKRTVYIPKIGRIFAMMDFFNSRWMDIYLKTSYK